MGREGQAGLQCAGGLFWCFGGSVDERVIDTLGAAGRKVLAGTRVATGYRENSPYSLENN